MIPRRVAAAVIGGAIVLGCRIDDRTPRDEVVGETIRATVASYYRNRSAADWQGTRTLFWDSATVQVRTLADGGWRTFPDADAFIAALAARSAGGLDRSPDPVRIDLRQESGLAAAWVTTRVPAAGPVGVAPGGETRVDHLVLRQIGDAWRIVHLMSAPELDEAVP